MNQQEVIQMTQQIMKEDKNLFETFASEKHVTIKRQEEEDVIDDLMKLIPKSTEGKILAAGAIALLAFLYFKSK